MLSPHEDLEAWIDRALTHARGWLFIVHDSVPEASDHMQRIARAVHGEARLPKPEYTDRSLRGRDAGLAESSAGVPAFAGRCRSEQARLGGAEGAVARVREACAGMLARASGAGPAL